MHRAWLNLPRLNLDCITPLTAYHDDGVSPVSLRLSNLDRDNGIAHTDFQEYGVYEELSSDR